MKKIKNIWVYEALSFMFSFLISLIVVFLITTYIARPVSVEGSSMYPTLHDDDISFSSLMNLSTSGIERFDIVVVNLEEDNKFIVKRVIGLPNETVEFKDEILYIDGEPINEPFLETYYAISEKNSGTFTSDVEKTTLGEDEYYLMGDNRSNSLDSRKYGAFKLSDITSKHMFVIYPFENFGIKQ